MTTCVVCGDPSNRGCIQVCRKCSPLQEEQYLNRVKGKLVISAQQAEPGYLLTTLADMDWAHKQIREDNK